MRAGAIKVARIAVATRSAHVSDAQQPRTTDPTTLRVVTDIGALVEECERLMVRLDAALARTREAGTEDGLAPCQELREHLSTIHALLLKEERRAAPDTAGALRLVESARRRALLTLELFEQ